MLKKIPQSLRIFFVTIAGLFILYFLPRDEFGTICGGKSLIPFCFGLLIFLIPLVFAIIEKIKKKISNIYFLIFLFLSAILFLIIWFFLNQGCNLCVHSWQSKEASLNQLRIAQEIFYERNGKYADSQDEIVRSGILTMSYYFTDEDGIGIEGGDNDSKTWSAETHISFRDFNKWCCPIEEEYWYVCNQNSKSYSREECDQLATRWVLHGRFCTSEKIPEYKDMCEDNHNEPGYHRYDIYVACTWPGETGRNQCTQLFNQIADTFRFLSD